MGKERDNRLLYNLSRCKMRKTEMLRVFDITENELKKFIDEHADEILFERLKIR